MKESKSLSDVEEKEMRRQVLKALKNYKALCVRMKNIEEQRKAGYDVVFPKVKEDEIHLLRFKQIERTLSQALDEDQRKIITMKYLGDKKLKDSYVYNELCISRDPYYEKKVSAIEAIATALGII